MKLTTSANLKAKIKYHDTGITEIPIKREDVLSCETEIIRVSKCEWPPFTVAKPKKRQRFQQFPGDSVLMAYL
jgi:hypothetical protein